ASPLLGAAFGGSVDPIRGGGVSGGLGALGLERLLALLAGSVLLPAHVFVFSDWAGRRADLNDPRRAASAFAHHGISSRTVAALTVGLLAIAAVALAALGFTAVRLG